MRRHGSKPAQQVVLVPSGNLPIFKQLISKVVINAGRDMHMSQHMLRRRDALRRIMVIQVREVCAAGVRYRRSMPAQGAGAIGMEMATLRGVVAPPHGWIGMIR
jgi:hypothetical protein